VAELGKPRIESYVMCFVIFSYFLYHVTYCILYICAMSFGSTPNGKTNDNDTTMSFGANTQLLAMKILPGVHRINIYAPVCHYFQSSTVHDECAKYWSSNNRSQLLGDMQLGTVNLSSLISNWDTSKYGEPPELDGPESKINLNKCSSQNVFLCPILSLPRHGFFESESVITTGSKIEIPMSEVAKYKMSHYVSFNRYSYFFPRTNQCEWQRHWKLFGNQGEVVVSVDETMTLREFIQEHISATRAKASRFVLLVLILRLNALHMDNYMWHCPEHRILLRSAFIFQHQVKSQDFLHIPHVMWLFTKS